MAKESNEKKLEKFKANIQKKYGNDSLIDLTNKEVREKLVEWIPLDSFDLSYLLGKGIPKGRILEWYGAPSTGKTSINLMIVGELQRQGYTCAWVDAEKCFDADYASRYLDVEKLILASPESGEDSLDIVLEMVESKLFDYIVIDSVAALSPQSELDGSMSDAHMGLQAKMINTFLRKVKGMSYRNKTNISFINQVRDNFAYGAPKKTVGGDAIAFYSSIRIETKVQEKIDDENKEKTILLIRLTCRKNKVSIPHRVAEVIFNTKKGIDTNEEVIRFAIMFNIVERKGAWYYLNEENKFQGKDKLIEYLTAKENKEIYDNLENQIKEKLGFTKEIKDSFEEEIKEEKEIDDRN